MTVASKEQLRVHEQSLHVDANRVLEFLESQGTFRFPTLSTGLFSAAAGEGDDFELTGYRSVWVRDNVHVAHAHLMWGDIEKAESALRSLMAFFAKHRHRFADIIEGLANPDDPMQRPHIRFDGNKLAEIDEKWSHAQNDALGAFLWLYCRYCDLRKSAVRPSSAEWEMLSEIVHFFKTVQYWQDEDSGHWEEVRKIAASSVGVAVAGIREYRKHMFHDSQQGTVPADFEYLRHGRPVSVNEVNDLLVRGEGLLEHYLPAECLQSAPSQRRLYDSAMLFLIYPYQVVSPEMADQIVEDVTSYLLGQHGIRRYVGDSYWCADYKEKLAADERTVDYSDHLADRDRLLQPGLEAQWCLFDPIISIHFGLRYDRTGNAEDRLKQVFHLNRSLSQLTPPGSRFGAFRCPESYYCEKGEYVPNDICPLLWTQANLKLALRLAGGYRIT